MMAVVVDPQGRAPLPARLEPPAHPREFAERLADFGDRDPQLPSGNGRRERVPRVVNSADPELEGPFVAATRLEAVADAPRVHVEVGALEVRPFREPVGQEPAFHAGAKGCR